MFTQKPPAWKPKLRRRPFIYVLPNAFRFNWRWRYTRPTFRRR